MNYIVQGGFGGGGGGGGGGLAPKKPTSKTFLLNHAQLHFPSTPCRLAPSSRRAPDHDIIIETMLSCSIVNVRRLQYVLIAKYTSSGRSRCSCDDWKDVPARRQPRGFARYHPRHFKHREESPAGHEACKACPTLGFGPGALMWLLSDCHMLCYSK